MTTEVRVDVDLLRSEIEKTYTEVSTEQGKDFIFPAFAGAPSLRKWRRFVELPEKFMDAAGRCRRGLLPRVRAAAPLGPGAAS